MADAKLVIEIEDDKGGGQAPPAPSSGGGYAPAALPPMQPAGSVPERSQAADKPPDAVRAAANEPFDKLATHADPSIAAYGAARAGGGDMFAGLAALAASWGEMKSAGPAGAVPSGTKAGSVPPTAPSSAGPPPLPPITTPLSPKPTPAGGTPPPTPSSAASAATGKAPTGTPAGSPVSAFDRPIPVIVVGPNPLPVIDASGGKGGKAGSTPPKAPPPPDTWAAWMGRQAGQAGYVGQRMGQAAEGLADNRAGPAVGAAVEVAAAGLSKLGPYGMAAGVALQAVGKVGTAASEAVKAFVERGRELSGFNGALAGANANADVRSLLADIREANDLGPGLAELTGKQSDTDLILRETLLPIKEFLIDHLNAFTNGVNVMMVAGLEGIQGVISAVSFGTAKSDAIEKALERIRGVLEGALVDPDPMKVWLEEAAKIPAKGIPAAARGDVLGIPLLMKGP